MTDEIRPAGGFREQPGYQTPTDGVSMTNAAHPQDEKMIERLCRAVCKVDGVNPDIESEGVGGVMPKGQRYKLWEARRKVVMAVLDELAVIDSELQLDEKNLETISIERSGRVMGELVQVEVRPGETIADAMVRQGITL
jgi:hypothetical protein